MKRFRGFYGGEPLHLLATVASFAVVVAGFAGWLAPGSDPRGILLWLLGSIVAVELVLIPLAWVLDRIAFGVRPWRRRAGAPVPAPGAGAGAGAAYVRVPALLSGLLLVVFAPLIFQFGKSTFISSTGLVPSGYLFRWLYATAALFGGSALLYAVKLRRARI
jgi:hypothetical protein